MNILGVTGSVCSGKTTVSSLLKKYLRSSVVFNFDDEIKKLYAHDESLKCFINTFFSDCVDSQGNILKKKILLQICKDTFKKRNLERFIYRPLYRKLFYIFQRFQHKDWIILDSPLLFESGLNIFCTYTINVSTSPFVRKKRFFLRTGMTNSDYKNFIKNQFSDDFKSNLSDIIVDNSLSYSLLKLSLKSVVGFLNDKTHRS